ncbi:MAG TPA: hypothetical protein VEM76_17480 [Anaeromyxobacteraceae bacterium]|nr:hypothetical protein [Anaeromyxobacteraceae bacterium]
MKELSVEAIKRSDGSRAPCLLRLPDRQPHSERCEIEAIMGQTSWTRADTDYFAALALVRRDLEAHGWLLSCYGASRNIYPSGMARDMGLGLKANKLHLGQRGRREDLVDIFTTGPDVEPASVDEQEAFHKEWLASIVR